MGKGGRGQERLLANGQMPLDDRSRAHDVCSPSENPCAGRWHSSEQARLGMIATAVKLGKPVLTVWRAFRPMKAAGSVRDGSVRSPADCSAREGPHTRGNKILATPKHTRCPGFTGHIGAHVHMPRHQAWERGGSSARACRRHHSRVAPPPPPPRLAALPPLRTPPAALPTLLGLSARMLTTGGAT